jgi:hypothetical protein
MFACIDWSREGRSMRHINAKSLINWIVVFPIKDEQIALGLIDALLQVCKPFGKIRFFPLSILSSSFLIFP